jgi:competence protein ComGC
VKKTPEPTPAAALPPRKKFTFAEIGVVSVTISVLIAIAIPLLLKGYKRSQATQIKEELRLLDEAIAVYSIENHKSAGDTFSWSDLKPHLKARLRLYEAVEPNQIRDILGNNFDSFDGTVNGRANGRGAVSVNPATCKALAGAVPLDFWSPFGAEH